MIKAWYHVSKGKTFSSLRSAIQVLQEAGLEMSPLKSRAPSGPGLVFFSEADAGLYDFLKEVSRSGFERVLAVALAPLLAAPDTAWKLLKSGASDLVSLDLLMARPEAVVARLARWRHIDAAINSAVIQDHIVGSSLSWLAVLRRIVEVAQFTAADVLLEGETGTGKEVLARLLHNLDPRTDKGELVVLDCTTVVPELSGSEFFGHERGAFTGAVSARNGAFALADGGTLFLDEIGELPLGLQAQLLRVIQEGTYKRVGGNTWHHTGFRLVSATNKDLLEGVRQGEFRRDLYYRISGVTCKLPNLHQRREDIIALVQYFMKLLRPQEEAPDLDEPVRSYFIRRDYPGNVRELKQLVTRIIYRLVGPGPVTVGHIPENEWPAETGDDDDWRDAGFEENIRRALNLGVGLKEIGSTAIDTAIKLAVGTAGGNLQRAAATLGVTARALQIRRASRGWGDGGPEKKRRQSGASLPER